LNAPAQTEVAAAAQAVAQTTRAPDADFDRLLQRSFTPLDLLQDENFDKLWRMAEALANSALSVPKELKGNIGDCLAIVTQAMIWGLNPFAVAQKAHVINGKLGYEAQLVNAVVMQSGAIRGSFRYEHEGDRCRVGAVLRGETEITWGEWLSAASVQVKNSPLWKVNPKQQMGYLQVKNWTRAYCPGALLGIYTADELEGIEGAMSPSAVVESLSKLPSLPAYLQADFDKNLPAWTKLVANGKKTAPDLFAMLSTKATFTEAQKAQILALGAPAPAAAATSADPFVAEMEAAEQQGDQQ
jgi:hypothetical protein